MYKEVMNDPFLNHKEPEEIFLPLSRDQYAKFYGIEMDAFIQDIQFYREHTTKSSQILELGCGTGRISRALAAFGHSVIGLDLSFSMLKKATHHVGNSPLYVCMDMTKMAFRQKFDHVLIPYNSLNLLRDKVSIARCLQQTHELLKPEGSLLLQLYIPDKQLLQHNGKKIFQFQIFPLDNIGGKLIKETLRSYQAETEEILLEERYRIRPIQDNGNREDLRHILHLAGFSLQQWISILQANGFNTLSLYGDYNSRPFQPQSDSLLLIQAHPS
ncbi:MAG: class I SAM-dependent methyltransferase [Desulfocapsa sp.]|nr:class I SAM-dependent methyltransferase [Desulfocapsa sp.]